MLIFEIQGIGWELSMMRISYKLTKKNNKILKVKKKNFKVYNIINVKNIRNKLTASETAFIQSPITSL